MNWFRTERKNILECLVVKPNPADYNLANSQYKKAFREAKERWLEEKCNEVENLSFRRSDRSD